MKTIFKRIMLLMMVVVLGLEGSEIYASAYGNIEDESFKRIYTFDVYDYATKVRTKLDYTSAYIYNQSSEALNVNVAAAASATTMNTTMEYIDASARGMVNVPKGTYKYLPNYVKERHYNYCYLVIMPCAYRNYTLIGKWSPDSI